MTQLSTQRFHAPGLPGHIFTPAESPGREPESMVMPYVMQELTFTLAGAPDPIGADGLFSITYPAPWGGNVVIQAQALAGDSLATIAGKLQTAWATSIPNQPLYAATTVGLVTTAVAQSYNVQIAPGLFATAAPVGYTITVAQTVAAQAPSLRLGVFCRYGIVQIAGAVMGTPRMCRPAATLVLATTIDEIRGVVAREANSVEQDANFDNSGPDAYPAGHVFPVLNRGEIATIVDPGSGVFGLGSEVHVIRNAGLGTIPGAVRTAADGANTLRMDNVGRARVTIPEWTFQIGSFSCRLVGLKVNQTL